MNIEYGCALDDAEAVAGLFFDGFIKETRRVFGEASSLGRIIRKSMNPIGCIMAREEGELVGMAILDIDDRHFFSPKFKHFKEEYGLLKALLKFAMMSMLGAGSNKGLFYLDTLAVRNDRRGTGVGTALLAEVEMEASRQGYSSIVLDVLDGNPRAKKLYESLGFIPASHHRRPFFKPLFGYSGYTRMEKKL